MDSNSDIKQIRHKWGFGMSPVKPEMQRKRVEAARTVRTVLDGAQHAALGRLDDISTVQGLFTQSYKRDQWHWFTVWSQLGFPAYGVVRQASGKFKYLRASMRDGDLVAARKVIDELTVLGVPEILDRFIAGTPVDTEGRGFIYILSTREDSELLKIGYTNRDVLTRTKEINSATGIVTPFGARAVWLVPDARTVEADVHALLQQYRIRLDREFFRMPFTEAVRIIDSYVEGLPSV